MSHDLTARINDAHDFTAEDLIQFPKRKSSGSGK